MSEEISHVEVDFIAPLSIHYSVRHENDDAKKAWREDYVDAMRGYSSEVLKEAAKRIMRKRNYSNFPLIADCLEACKSVLDDRNVGRSPDMGSHKGYPEWSHERQRKAAQMICCELGKRAAKEGWVISLWDFCRNKDRLPQRHEIDKLIAGSRGTWQAMKEIDDKNAMAPALRNLEQTLIKRRQKLTELVLGVSG